MANYTWLTFAQAKAQLAQRLADVNNRFWTDVEKGIYLVEALRVYNALTATWNAEFQFAAPINPNQIWYDLSALPNSPRLRTVTDADVFTAMRYHLLEPPTGSLTSQFTQADLTAALQSRRDEMIQTSACNIQQITTASTPGIRRTYLPDTTLEVVRARFVPTAPPPFDKPATLWRDDNLSFEYFEPDYLQQPQQTPFAYDVVSIPPLALDVDVPPNVAGNYDLITIQSGTPFNPPALTLLGVPDDFAWVVKWGALADLLGRESEATDRARAAYCLQRYLDGLKLLTNAPWMLLARLNDIAVDTPSLAEQDRYEPNWDTAGTLTWANVVTVGIDTFAVAPVPQPTDPQVSVFVNVVGNAPVPVLDGDFVQVSRDAWDSILSYAQFLATFKMGGAEFQQAQSLEKEFILNAMGENARLKKLGIFTDVLRAEGTRQEREQERVPNA